MYKIYNNSKDKLFIEAFSIGDLGSNCTVVYGTETKDAIIFDPGNDARPLINYIKDNSLKVDKLIHTHAHFDHIGQSSEVQNATQSEMYLHRDDLVVYESLKDHAMLFGQVVSENPNPINHFLNEGDKIGLKESDLAEIFEVIHVPGHSPGGICFFTEYFDTPILIAGDALFQGSIGRTDLPGGNYNQFIQGIKSKLLTLPENTLVITGHGPSTVIGQEKKFNPFLS